MADDPQDTPPAEPGAVAASIQNSADLDEQTAHIRLIGGISSFHSGPLPDPETLRAYSELIPDGADRIMILVEREAAHRHEQDARLITAKTRRLTRGQWMAFVVTLTLAAAGVYLGVTGHDWLAAALFTTTIGAVVATFVLGNSARMGRKK